MSISIIPQSISKQFSITRRELIPLSSKHVQEIIISIKLILESDIPYFFLSSLYIALLFIYSLYIALLCGQTVHEAIHNQVAFKLLKSGLLT